MKSLEINQIYHGFQLKKCEKLGDISATGYLFTHIKSGARLCYIETEDNNKVFSVSFKTPPDNDCGTPHILEHSVLCGSRKYQAKEVSGKGSIQRIGKRIFEYIFECYDICR